MNEDILITLTRKKIIDILQSSNLSVSVLYLLVKDITQELQQLMDATVQKEYSELKKTDKINKDSKGEE